MSDSVVFELPDFAEADDFSLSVGAEIPDSITHEGDTWLVVVGLSPEASSLALILRRAEAWLTETGLGGVWFHLDGRPYLLHTAAASEKAA
jgi:hypothetical protein